MRAKIRIPKVMKFFKNNFIAFGTFVSTGSNLQYSEVVHIEKLFSENYEELFYEWMEYPDLRFGQLLINKGIVPDGKCWNLEEVDWLIKHGYFKPEELQTWGTYGIDGEANMKAWYEEKPLYGSPVEIIDRIIFKEPEKASKEDLFGERYHRWKKRQPQPEYRFIKDLDVDHIKNILKISNIANRDVFERVLKQKENGY